MYICMYIYIFIGTYISERGLSRLAWEKKMLKNKKQIGFPPLPIFIERRVEVGNGSASTDRSCTGINPESSGVYTENVSQSPPNESETFFETLGVIGYSANKTLRLHILINSLQVNSLY